MAKNKYTVTMVDGSKETIEAHSAYDDRLALRFYDVDQSPLFAIHRDQWRSVRRMVDVTSADASSDAGNAYLAVASPSLDARDRMALALYMLSNNGGSMERSRVKFGHLDTAKRQYWEDEAGLVLGFLADMEQAMPPAPAFPAEPTAEDIESMAGQLCAVVHGLSVDRAIGYLRDASGREKAHWQQIARAAFAWRRS